MIEPAVPSEPLCADETCASLSHLEDCRMSLFALQSSTQAERCKVTASGEIDIQAVDGFLAACTRPLDEPGIRCLAIDLAAVTFIDSAGIVALIQLHKRSLELGKQLILERPSSRVLQVLDMTALDTMFTIDPVAAGVEEV
jgi:anti-sigma B factor antagonist